MNTIRSLMNIHGNRVAHIDDEREMGNNIIVTLHAGWFFKDEPDCGVRGFDTLKELKEMGLKLACVTNKTARFTNPLMETAGLAPYFDFIASGDTFSDMKPSPIPLLETAKKMGIDPEKTWMIGDSINDISAGKQANFKTVAVSYGYAGQCTMAELNATYTLNSLPELVALIQNEI